jgi:hypothetical protein
VIIVVGIFVTIVVVGFASIMVVIVFVNWLIIVVGASLQFPSSNKGYPDLHVKHFWLFISEEVSLHVSHLS